VQLGLLEESPSGGDPAFLFKFWKVARVACNNFDSVSNQNEWKGLKKWISKH